MFPISADSLGPIVRGSSIIVDFLRNTPSIRQPLSNIQKKAGAKRRPQRVKKVFFDTLSTFSNFGKV